jgi:hypothetical protein
MKPNYWFPGDDIVRHETPNFAIAIGWFLHLDIHLGIEIESKASILTSLQFSAICPARRDLD